MDWLATKGEARLTGTGGCVFAAFPDRAAALDALSAASGHLSGFVARGLNRSPLLESLDLRGGGQ
jgi:4-diphosphocytidyl-2-C-methyl-D-erythritol kinase